MKSINPLYTGDPGYEKLQDSEQPNFRAKLASVLSNETPSEAIDLIASLLEFEPEKRITAHEALSHPYFDEIKTPVAKSPGIS
jgi:serine/threonine protein kinase